MNYYNSQNHVSKDCSRVFWRQELPNSSKSEFGEGWSRCFLFSHEYDLGYKVLEHFAEESTVIISDCRKHRLDRKWKTHQTGMKDLMVSIRNILCYR